MPSLTKDQVSKIIQNAPAGSSPHGIVAALRQKGYDLEGYNATVTSEPTTTIDKVDSFLTGFGKGVLKSIKGFADIGQRLVSAPERMLTGEQFTPSSNELVSDINKVGAPGTNIINPVNKTEQVGTTAEQISEFFVPVGGEVEALKNASKAPKLIQKGVQLAKNTLPSGISSGLIQSAQENETNPEEIAKNVGVNTAIAAVAPVALKVIGNTINKGLESLAPALKTNALERYKKGFEVTKEKFKTDLDKIAPDLMDEGYWGSMKNILAKANKNIDIAESDYEKLGELQGVLNPENVSQLETRIQKQYDKYLAPNGSIISAYKGKADKLERISADIQAFKDASGSIKMEDLKSLRQAYDSITYGIDAEGKEAKTIYTQFANTIRDILGKENPDFAAVNEMYHKASKTKKLIEATMARKQNKAGIGLLNTLWGGTGLTVGSAMGGLPGGIATSMALMGASKFFTSTLWRTSSAVLQKGVAEGLQKLSPNALKAFFLLPEETQQKITNEYLIGKSANTFDISNAFTGLTGKSRNALTSEMTVKIPKAVGSTKVDSLQEYINEYYQKNKKFPILKNIIDNPDLFKAYPELGNIQIGIGKFKNPDQAGAINFENRIKLSPDADLTQVLPHELQHGIQILEHELNARTYKSFTKNLDSQKAALENILTDSTKLKDLDIEHAQYYQDLLSTLNSGKKLPENAIADLKTKAPEFDMQNRFENEAHQVSKTENPK